jgi:NAD(P)H dehydrogenase (quinone)
MARGSHLLERGLPVRALVRRIDARSETLRAAGAVIAVGSMTDLADMQRALADVQRVYLCPPWGPDLLHVVGRLRCGWTARRWP